MELFRKTTFQFLSKRWLFVSLSLTLALTLAGIYSLISKGGPRFGVEFRGGAVMDLQWNGPPPLARIRSALSSRLAGVSVIEAHDVNGSNEVLISTELSPGQDSTVFRNTIEASLDPGAYSFRGVDMIGPQISSDLRRQAFMATAGASAGMLAYIAWRFRWIYGVAAVAAVIHDTLITVGLLSLANQEISLAVVAALLTLIGYSMNDTIVVFDRIRENRRARPGEPLAQVVNASINQTLSRTILTSGLTLLTALSLFLFGGPVLHGFSFALVAGILVGTYSSIFIASPILVAWERFGGAR
jgi:preprotein translocase subunit SecF